MKIITVSPVALQQLEDWKKSDPKHLSKIISLFGSNSICTFYRNR